MIQQIKRIYFTQQPILFYMQLYKYSYVNTENAVVWYSFNETADLIRPWYFFFKKIIPPDL